LESLYTRRREANPRAFARTLGNGGEAFLEGDCGAGRRRVSHARRAQVRAPAGRAKARPFGPASTAAAARGRAADC